MPLEESITGWQPILNTVLDVVVAKARMGIVGVSIGDCKEIIGYVAKTLGKSTTSIEGGFAHLVSQRYVRESDGLLQITHEGWQAYGGWDSRRTGKSREEWLRWSGDTGDELPPIHWNEMSAEQTGDVAKNDAVDELKADQAGTRLVPVKVEPVVAIAVAVLERMTKAVNGRCAKLKKLWGETQAEAIGVGKDLIAIRAYLQENNIAGGFEDWVAREFNWSRSQAYRLIAIAAEFGECLNLGHYDQSAMYVLAAPGTPQEAKDEAKELADTGEFVDYSTAATLIDKHKPALGHERGEELLNEGDEDEEASETPPPVEAGATEQEKPPPAEDADPEKQTPPADAEKTTTPPAPPKKQPEKPNRQPVHNYKCGSTTKVIAEQTEPGNLLVTLKSLESPSGNSTHDLLIQLDRKLAANLHHELGQALAVKSNRSQGKTASPSKKQQAQPKVTKGKIPPSKKQQPKPKADKGTITIRKLNSSYGVHAASVLEDYLDELERKDGGMRTYKIAKALPTEAEFKELQTKKYTSTVAELVGSAFGDLENLASEMGDWYDNLPEGFQNSDKGSVLDETRGTLEGLSEPDVPDAIAKKEVYYLPLLNASSRAAQRDDAVGRLQAVVDVLDSDEGDSEIKEFIADLENAIGEAEGVEFPGMY